MSLIPMVNFTNRQAITVAGSAGTAAGASSTNHVINLPSTIQIGDLLVVTCGQNTGTFTVPSGWTIFSGATTGSSQPPIWKYADGTESSTLTIVSNVSEGWAGLAWRITGVDPSHTAPEMQFASGTSSTPDPPSITPSWGATVTSLYIANYSGPTFSAYPTNYTLGQLVESTFLAGAARSLKSSPENPGSFTASVSGVWLARTIACKGAF